MKMFRVLICFLGLSCFLSCASTGNVQKQTDNLSVATVQREIKIGMSSSEVVEILGSPNMITTDDQRRENWVYDKISTQIDSSSSSSGVWLVVVGGSKSKNAYSSSQKTLTIIIKFDNGGKVRDFSYRTSSF